MAIDLKKLFQGLQIQLEASLRAAREVIAHPGAKGEASELNWLRMLTDHLPARYHVSKAFVIDSAAQISDQVDIVIYDHQYSPLLFKQDGALFVPAESVYAVFEVKQELNKENIAYAGAKTASVRRLRRTSVPIPHAGGTFSPRQHFPILAGILSLDSTWKPPLGDSLTQALQALSKDARLDLGCALLKGAFDAFYSNSDPPSLKRSAPDSALVFLFLRLLQRLQQLGTVPAIDLGEYGRELSQ